MWWLRAMMVLVPALNPINALAAEGFLCGGADVRFSFEKRVEVEDHVEVVMTVGRNDRETVLRYDGNVDFIGGICVKNLRGKPIILFQAYCGGSGCRDMDNWGLIDPSDLHVLLVPNDWNRADAEKIFGNPLPKIGHMISVSEEAETSGSYGE